MYSLTNNCKVNTHVSLVVSGIFHPKLCFRASSALLWEPLLPPFCRYVVFYSVAALTYLHTLRRMGVWAISRLELVGTVLSRMSWYVFAGSGADIKNTQLVSKMVIPTQTPTRKVCEFSLIAF